jgi:hypothetical protein
MIGSRRLAASVLSLAVLLWAAPICSASGPRHELIVCGWDEVFILDVSGPAPRKTWSWRAAERPELPEHMRSQFQTTDECKPIDGGKRILITASSDGVALVERRTGAVLFYASVVNAHSAELLPGGRVAVAASHRPDADGDRLVLFDLQKPEEPLFHTELYSGHGVVWDDERRLLWALGGDHLRTYRLRNGETSSPALEMEDEYDLPDSGGHDLYPVPDASLLFVTTRKRVWTFDTRRRTFSPHPQLSEVVEVKGVSMNPVTRQVVYVKADEGRWWTDTLRFLGPERTIELPGERLYKARWNVRDH